MFRWCFLTELQRIERKLDIIISLLNPDFSKEDAQVRKMTENLQEAKKRIPPEQKP